MLTSELSKVILLLWLTTFALNLAALQCDSDLSCEECLKNEGCEFVIGRNVVTCQNSLSSSCEENEDLRIIAKDILFCP